MRIIKFRSWNPRGKTMDFPDNIANDIDGDRCQIMQFTGLRDKNSVDIYEGDVLRYDYSTHAITFRDGCFWWGEAPINILKRLDDLGNFEKHEVIGNIYEHGIVYFTQGGHGGGIVQTQLGVER